jgi:uncharacterized protein (TIGR03435 family)
MIHEDLRMIRKVCGVALLGLGLGTALGQAPADAKAAPVASKANAPAAKALAFDVISIKSNPSMQRMGPPVFGPTADGYRMVAAPFLLPIISAYIPTTGAAAFLPNQIKGLPDWAMQEGYDLNARVAEEDMAEWQKPESQKTMLAAMMQSLLEDRCKMVVHRETKDSSVYLLEVGKNGPKFKETDPTVEHPDGMKLPWGGVMVPGKNGMTLYGASMASVATMLSSFGGGMGGGGRQIQDKTGLTGKYDITINPQGMGGPQGPGDGGPQAFDPAGMMMGVVDSLGLKLESSKATVETLVIDHIEKPSAN